MIIKKILIPLFLGTSFSVCQANTDIFISGGIAISKLHNTEAVRINDFVVNDYVTDKHTKVEPLGGLGISQTFEDIAESDFDISLGIAGYYVDFDKVKGTEHPFANAGDFDTLNYQFRASSTALMFEGRLVYARCCWQPYLLGGIGIGWNRLADYKETPTNPSLSAAPVPESFDNHTRTSFAYEVGVGIQRPFYISKKHEIEYIVALDYRYMDFGKGELGSFPAQTSNDRLTVKNMNTQAVVLSLKASF